MKTIIICLALLGLNLSSQAQQFGAITTNLYPVTVSTNTVRDVTSVTVTVTVPMNDYLVFKQAENFQFAGSPPSNADQILVSGMVASVNKQVSQAVAKQAMFNSLQRQTNSAGILQEAQKLTQ